VKHVVSVGKACSRTLDIAVVFSVFTYYFFASVLLSGRARSQRGAAEKDLGSMPRPSAGEEHDTDADALDELQDTDLCEDCDEVLSDFFCNVCQCSLCRDCWDRQPAHRRKRLAPGQIPHEKTELLLANRIQTVFSFSGDARTFERLHEDDEITAWFGMLSPNLFISPGDR
jgi:hypothetical protein